MNPNERFGKRLYDLRKELDMTQEDLAQRLNVTNQSVSKWELGQCYPDITLLADLAEIFKVTTDELLGVAAPDAPDRLARQIRAVFAGTPKEDIFELAVRLAGKLHEGVCTMGYQEKVPWKIRGELGGLEWGFSARVEPEGATARRDRTIFLSARGGQGPNANDIRKLAQTLAALGDRAVLTVLYALDEHQPQARAALLAQGISPEELEKAVSTLPIEETEDGLSLIGCYQHAPKLLGMLFEMRGMLL